MQQLIDDIAAAIRAIDRSGVAFKQFRPGVGPYGEPQLVRAIAAHLRDQFADRYAGAKTARVPDVLIPQRWALEFKVARPFGDNGKEAEHWSQNLLHPYAGNVSALADAMKLLKHSGPEQRAVIVIGYEHEPPQIDLSMLIGAFELVARELLAIPLGDRHTAVISDCIHPVHRRTTVYGWTVGDVPALR